MVYTRQITIQHSGQTPKKFQQLQHTGTDITGFLLSFLFKRKCVIQFTLRLLGNLVQVQRKISELLARVVSYSDSII